jgi:hypothetical protein
MIVLFVGLKTPLSQSDVIVFIVVFNYVPPFSLESFQILNHLLHSGPNEVICTNVGVVSDNPAVGFNHCSILDEFNIVAKVAVNLLEPMGVPPFPSKAKTLVPLWIVAHTELIE